MLDSQSRKEIKLLTECAEILDCYRYSTTSLYNLITTPDSMAWEKKQLNLYKRIIKRIVQLRGYVKFEVAFYLYPSSENGIVYRRIKATSYENIFERLSEIYKNKNFDVQKIKVVS